MACNEALEALKRESVRKFFKPKSLICMKNFVDLKTGDGLHCS